jgi:hypothetical protein
MEAPFETYRQMRQDNVIDFISYFRLRASDE